MNITEIQKIATTAAWKHPSRLLPYEDRVTAAHDSITEAICTGDPTDPVIAGLRGITNVTQAERQTHGLTLDGEQRPRYTAYWNHQHESPYDQIEDQIAVRQVWQALPPAHQGTLSAFMNAGTISAAANALEVPHDTFARRLNRARAAARELWHSPEPAPPHWHKTHGGGQTWSAAVNDRKHRRKAQGGV